MLQIWRLESQRGIYGDASASIQTPTQGAKVLGELEHSVESHVACDCQPPEAQLPWTCTYL